MRSIGMCSAIAAAWMAAAAAAGAQTGALGRTEFPTSGSPAAQEHFLRGALLLHSFEYPDAADEFRKAQALEPGFAMAYWGEAMTYNHPLWMEQDRDEARKTLQKLAPTAATRLAKAPTPRERMYLEAVEALYGEGERDARDRAYAEAMRRLHEAFPEDLDAEALYALSLLGTTEGKRDFAVYMKAAALVEEVFARNPQHPGAAHYLIHCYDDPVHAPLGMRAARVYAGIAPAAVHALHMPSHIFFASGMWAEAVSSNEASWAASVARAEKLKLGAAGHSFHALSWLQYAYLQLGRWKDARSTLATGERDTKAGGGGRGGDFSSMRASWIVETGRCGDGVLPPPEATEPRDRFARGLCALAAEDTAGARRELDAMRASPGKAEEAHSHGGSTMTYGGPRGGASVPEALGKELEAKLAQARGDRAAAVTLAKEAAAAEDAITFEFGPPVVVKPAHELLGEILLEQGRAAEARAEFETALAHAPGRSLSLLGLARAAAKSGDAAASCEAYAALAKNWARADQDLPGRSELSAASGGE